MRHQICVTTLWRASMHCIIYVSILRQFRGEQWSKTCFPFRKAHGAFLCSFNVKLAFSSATAAFTLMSLAQLSSLLLYLLWVLMETRSSRFTITITIKTKLHETVRSAENTLECNLARRQLYHPPSISTFSAIYLKHKRVHATVFTELWNVKLVHDSCVKALCRMSINKVCRQKWP